MISYDEATALVLAEARPLAAETVPLEAAEGRVLAADLTARGDAPRTAVSAMDGYAVRDADLAALPAHLPVAATVFAGDGRVEPLATGTCARVFTGGQVPPGADRVVVQEIVGREGDMAVFEAAPGGGRHIRAAGSDFRAGETLLAAGTMLDYRAMVAAAAADRAEVEAIRRPRVAILSTGDELAAPGEAWRTPGALPESVSFGVAALARRHGAEVVLRRRLGDVIDTLRAAAREALEAADVVVVTGGASVGERDFARAMFEDAGLEVIFAKAAIKPGKPVWFGRAGGRRVLGLPGNPTSALVTARLFLAPLVAGLAGRDPAATLAWRDLPLGAALPAAGDRETFDRARVIDGAVFPLSDQDSGAQKMLAAADVLIRRRPGQPSISPEAMAAILEF